MPRLKRNYLKKAKRKKSKYIRRRKFIQKKKWAKIPLSIAPLTKMVKLKYCELVELNPALLSFSTAEFVLNSLHDPNNATVDVDQHQPRFYDQCMSLYRKWRVVGARVTMKPIGPDIGEDHSKFATCYGLYLHPEDDTTFPLTDYIDLMESPMKVRYGHIGLDHSKSKTVSMNVSMKKYFGVSNLADDVFYTGTEGYNPGKKCLLSCFAVNPQGQNPNTYYYKVQIEFVCVFSDPKWVDKS